jgi:hypothetical protein
MSFSFPAEFDELHNKALEIAREQGCEDDPDLVSSIFANLTGSPFKPKGNLDNDSIATKLTAR